MQLRDGMRVRRVSKLLFNIQSLLFRQLDFEDTPQQGMTVTIHDNKITYLTAAQSHPRQQPSSSLRDRIEIYKHRIRHDLRHCANATFRIEWRGLHAFAESTFKSCAARSCVLLARACE